MFRISVFSSGLVLLVAGLFATPALQANHAEEFFRNCNDDLEHLTKRCVNRNRETTENCVREIRQLLEQGREEAARHLARRCITRIERQTKLCLNDMEEFCQRCVRRLLHFRAPELARRFRHNCERASGVVHESGRRGIHRIRELFGDGGGDER